MEITSAVLRARDLAENFPLPFLTTREVESLFGEEVARALRLLDSLNARKSVCSNCGGKCCHQLRCEVYASEFGRCPIFSLRPVLCRFNFCHLFGKENSDMAKKLISVATDTLSTIKADTPAAEALTMNVLLYRECRDDNDPCPELITRMHRIVDTARAELISWKDAERSLLAEVLSYRFKTKLKNDALL